MLNRLMSPRNNFQWTVFHVLLGIVSTLTPFAIIGWVYLVILTTFPAAIGGLQRGRYVVFIALLCYLVSFEMLDRMAKTSPFLPLELGKYMLIAFMLLGLLLRGVRSSKGIWMAILISPALFYDLSGRVIFFDIINNYFGALGLALGIACLYRVNLDKGSLDNILRLIWLGSLGALAHSYIETPQFEEIEFGFGANFYTTGGASSNQVATIMGLGMFLTFYAILQRLKFSGYFLLDIGIMLLFAFQGLLTFSRGGMLIALLCMLILYFFLNRERVTKNRGRTVVIILALAAGIYGIFQATNEISGGKLLLRYQGETQGTYGGYKEKTLDVATSGRLGILQKDIALWLEHPLLGVGVGASRYLRGKVSAHIELTRLLSEHGVPGLMYFLLQLVVFYRTYRLQRDPLMRGVVLSLFAMALLTAFHSAMRTYVSPVFMALANLNVYRQLPQVKTSVPARPVSLNVQDTGG
jgi:O-antigen ligase